MISSRSIEFAAYVPEWILRRAQQAHTPPAAAEEQRVPGVALFADVAGSTKLANQLAGLGRLVGPEEMARILNAYYGPLISLLHARGGDVVGFAGDAVLAVWPTTESGLRDAVRQATQAALEIQRDLNNMELAEGVRLSLRICIGAGELSIALVGGRQDFWQLICHGPPLDQIRAAGDVVRIGEVFLSREAFAFIRSDATAETIPEGGAFVRRLASPPSPPSTHGKLDPASLPEQALRPYVPRAVQVSIDAGQSEFLDQSRTVSTLFVRIVRPAASTPSLENMQTTMSLLQDAMARYEGTVAQLMEDDKGLIAVLAFGLPPVGHEDDAARAVDAAVYLRERARERRVTCGIGISTGVPFCGPLGSRERRVYTVTGADVIRAARLMQLTADGEILCDEPTHASAHKATSRQFQRLPRFFLKGFEVPVRVFQVADHSLTPSITPDADEETAIAHVRTRLHAEELGSRLLAHLRADPLWMEHQCEQLLLEDRLVADHGVCELIDVGASAIPITFRAAINLVGRRTERAAIAGVLDAVSMGASRVILIEGDTGTGKSRLLEEMRTLAADRKLLALTGRCSSVETATPYFPWRAAFDELLGLPGIPDATERGSHILHVLENRPPLLPYAPLLNDLFGLVLPQDDVVLQMTGQTRADNLHDVLVGLLDAAAAGRPLVVMLEDSHWADSASWRLTKLVRERMASVAIAMSVRPGEGTLPAEYDSFVAAEWTDRMTLDAMSEADTRELACVRLGVDHLAEALAQLVWRRTQGSPLFIEQVVDHLAAAGMLEVHDGTASLKPGAGHESEPSVPDTIRGLVTARIDRLRPAHQLTAKVSSVIGPLFPWRALAGVYPDPSSVTDLPKHTLVLVQERLLRQDRPDPDAVYDFPHPVFQQVCYELLPRPQRVRLHHSAAAWFEGDQSESGSSQFRLIAHHWGRAGEVEKQTAFLARAGEAAMRDGAFREAVTGFTELLRLSRDRFGEKPTAEEQARRAHWEFQLGEAHFGLGELPAALEHLRQSLVWRNRECRCSKAGMLFDTLVQVGKQFIRRLFTWRKPRAGTGNLDDLEAAATYNRMGRINYYMNDILPGTNATLRALNLSESAGPSPELATAYGSVMILTGLLNFQRAARVYASLAESVAREIGKLPTLSVILAFLCMYRLGQGEWARVEAMAKESLDLAERLGDHHQCGEVTTILAMLCCFRADYAAAMQWSERMIAAAKRSGNTMHVAWALNIQGECLLRLGRFDEAVPKLNDSAAALHGNKDRTEEIRIFGMLAEVAVRKGNLAEARTHAETAEAVARFTSAVTVSTLEGFVGIAEARFALAEAERISSTHEATRDALAGLRKHAKLYPVGRPRMALFDGRLLQLRGSTAKAVRVWRKGLERARELVMPLDEALLHDILARHLPHNTVERRDHLLSAIALYERLGMAFELERVRTDCYGTNS